MPGLLILVCQNQTILLRECPLLYAVAKCMLVQLQVVRLATIFQLLNSFEQDFLNYLYLRIEITPRGENRAHGEGEFVCILKTVAVMYECFGYVLS